MACFAPLQGYRSRSIGPSGKRPIVFNPDEGFLFLPVVLPCGQCSGCRLERARQWAIRCVHEASLHDSNCFITLTYAPAFLPVGGSLVKAHFQKFMKRLRRRFPDDKIRFFQAGEYGEKEGRPHYHALLFGFDFPDKLRWKLRKGFQTWRSPILEALWPFGDSEIGSVTFESASYVARYIMGKVTGSRADEHYLTLDEESGELIPVIPEYVTMSRGGRGKGSGGIGAPWFEKYGREVYPADSVVMRGRLMKPPRFYDGRYELLDAPGMLEVSRARRASRRLEDETPERLAVREKCTQARIARSERGLE